MRGFADTFSWLACWRSEGFTGEEAEGKFVDMHGLHESYLNLKGAERIDYSTYLKTCASLESLPKTTATTGSYVKYAKNLREYFMSYLRRTQPLMPLSKVRRRRLIPRATLAAPLARSLALALAPSIAEPLAPC